MSLASLFAVLLVFASVGEASLDSPGSSFRVSGFGSPSTRAEADVNRSLLNRARTPNAPTTHAPTAQDTTTHDTTVADPNRVPYRSDRSFGRHVLAFPSYLLDGVTRPIGWGVKYLEREYPALFEPQVPVRGVIPLIELGGPVGVQGGLAAFDRNLFGSGHSVRASALYGSRSRYEIDLEYGIGDALGSRTSTAFGGELFTNPERRFFRSGNDARRTDETRYFLRQFSGRATMGLRPLAWLDGTVEATYSRTLTKPADGVLGERLPRDLPALNQTIQFVSLSTGWRLNATRQLRDRTVSGTRLVFDGRYSHDLDGDDLRHVMYGVEIQQYIPLGLLPPTRRLALRARVEKVEPVRGGAGVPFFRLPGIGGQTTVRSLVFERFVQEGALVLNAEYNYPIWNQMDAVVFVDAGQVFNEFEEIAADRFSYGYGGGIRVAQGGNLAFRFELAGGEGNLRTILTVNQMF